MSGNRILTYRTPVIIALVLLGILVVRGYADNDVLGTPSLESPKYPTWESRELFTFPGDWELVSGISIRTIYPAQASWQYITSMEHSGSSSVEAGTSCATCHGSPIVGTSTVAGWAGPPADHRKGFGCQACHGVLEQKVERLGERLVADPLLEQDPIEGKRPYIDVEVKAAYDSEYLYMRFEWASERPGITHDLLRWDGEKWVKWGGPKPDAPKKGIMPSYEDRLTINVADTNLPAYDGAKVGFSQVGCWLTCHSGMRAMLEEPSIEEVKAYPYLGDAGLKKSDVRKYLLVTRTEIDEAGGWDKVKSEEDIKELFEEGQFLDMLMWRASRSGPIGYADDLYVLDYRLRDEGTGSFKTQKKVEYMYDESKVGFRAIPEDRLEEMLSLFPLIKDETAVPLDPNAEFNIGDILSRRLIIEPEGSAADILTNSRWEDGKWVLELRRKMDTGNPDDKVFEPGKIYTLGVAIFDDMVSNRRHHVSFPVTLGIGVDADIQAISIQMVRGGENG